MNDAVPAILVGVVLTAFGAWMLIDNLRGRRHPGMLFGVLPLPASFWFPALLVAGGFLCGTVAFQASSASGPARPTPSAPKPTSAAQTSPPTAVPKPTPAWSPYWVKNHEITDMWSGPVRQAGVISFGKTSAQFCSFRVERPQDNERLYVLNPLSKNYFWVDARAVGPAPPPERRAGAPPKDVNCSDGIYD